MDTIEYWKRQWNSVAEDNVGKEINSLSTKNSLKKGWYENSDGKIFWIDKDVEDAEKLSKNSIYKGDAVILFNGSRKERLGGEKNEENIFHKDSILAKVFVYGPKGEINKEKDFEIYRGFSMSSDYKAFGAIEDGEYKVSWKPSPNNSNRGTLPKNWILNNGEPIKCLDGINYAYQNGYTHLNPYSLTHKNCIYIHRCNNNGKAGPYMKDGLYYGRSTGCLMIVPSGHIENGCKEKGIDEFTIQLRGARDILLILKRT